MDPNVVKVVLDFDGNALYFSRAPIPWVRDRGVRVHARHLKHLGLYAFRRAALLEFATFPQGDLERVEQLEQLRWLENGYRIRVAETEHDSVSVDIPEDVARVEALALRALTRQRDGPPAFRPSIASAVVAPYFKAPYFAGGALAGFMIPCSKFFSLSGVQISSPMSQAFRR